MSTEHIIPLDVIEDEKSGGFSGRITGDREKLYTGDKNDVRGFSIFAEGETRDELTSKAINAICVYVKHIGLQKFLEGIATLLKLHDGWTRTQLTVSEDNLMGHTSQD